jgi:SAM-dependent MidA family methyltransferase
MTDLVERLRKQIQEKGPLSFRDYMEEVLRFYYASARNPIGREGDYYTSADLDPVFGKLLAAQFTQWSAEFDSFGIIELGAGNGLLARDILEHGRFPYFILERSPAMRARQQESLRDYDVRWIDELPTAFKGCIFSNEFFDALPVHRVVRRSGVLKEIYVGPNFEEVEGDLQEPMDVPVQEGYVAEINSEARNWIRRIAATLERGYHLAIDYGYLAKEFYAQPRGTLMCYWQHQAVENPYTRIGEQDITAHVNFSDLMDAGSDVGLQTIRFTTQMEYLVGLGLLDEIQQLAVKGDAASMARLVKMKKLILPDSMGQRFKVLVQTKRGVGEPAGS